MLLSYTVINRAESDAFSHDIAKLALLYKRNVHVTNIYKKESQLPVAVTILTICYFKRASPSLLPS